MEKKKLTNWQKGFIAIGAFIIILFLFYMFGISPFKRDMRILVKREIPERRQEYETAIEIKNRYLLLQKELAILKSQIAQRSKDFDLGDFMATVRKKLGFIPTSETLRESTMDEKYREQKATYAYQNKTLGELVDYLYEIENPEHAIIIETLTIDPDDREGKKFIINIRMSVISSIEEKE